jgi:hypothetical protein
MLQGHEMMLYEDDGVPIIRRPTTTSSKKEVVSTDTFHPNYRFWSVFAAFAVLTLMVAIDSTSLSVALSVIAHKLHGSAIEAFWTGTSFLLASTVFVWPCPLSLSSS